MRCQFLISNLYIKNKQNRRKCAIIRSESTHNATSCCYRFVFERKTNYKQKATTVKHQKKVHSVKMKKYCAWRVCVDALRVSKAIHWMVSCLVSICCDAYSTVFCFILFETKRNKKHILCKSFIFLFYLESPGAEAYPFSCNYFVRSHTFYFLSFFGLNANAPIVLLFYVRTFFLLIEVAL